MAVTVPYYEFREVLSVRDADRDTFRTLADLAGRRVGTLGGTIAYEILLRAEARARHRRAVSYDDDVHPYSRSGARPRRRRPARQRARRAAQEDDRPASRFSRTAWRPATTSACSRRRTPPLRDRDRRDPARARCATARSSGSSASGTSGTTTSRSSIAQRARRRADPAGHRRRPVAARVAADRAGTPRCATCRRCCAPRSSPSLLSCLSMALAVVARRADRERARLRRPAAARRCSPATSS